MFRQFCGLLQQRLDLTYRDLSPAGKLKARLGRFRRGLEFSFNSGVPTLPVFPEKVSLSDVNRAVMRPLNRDEALSLSRFVAAKLFGKQYFGASFFNYSWLDGINFLILITGAVMWYARALALARGAAELGDEDVIEAIRYVDLSYGSSRAPAQMFERLRVALLSSSDTAVRLAIAQYGRALPAGT